VKNEQICSTAIYYYDIENITPSCLAFRQVSDVTWAGENVDYEQGDWNILAWKTTSRLFKPFGVYWHVKADFSLSQTFSNTRFSVISSSIL
jgi:hypothetical protein